MSEPTATFEAWAIVELMGHVRMAGRITEEEHFGAKLGRIDIPTREDGYTTQWFGGASIYRITPVTEEIARQVAVHNEPEPVHRWELPEPRNRRGLTDPQAEYTVTTRWVSEEEDGAGEEEEDDDDDFDR